MGHFYCCRQPLKIKYPIVVEREGKLFFFSWDVPLEGALYFSFVSRKLGYNKRKRRKLRKGVKVVLLNVTAPSKNLKLQLEHTDDKNGSSGPALLWQIICKNHFANKKSNENLCQRRQRVSKWVINQYKFFLF